MAGDRSTDAAQSEIVVDMAKALISLIREVAPSWKAAYFRFYTDERERGANASYADSSGVFLIGAVRQGDFYKRMEALSVQLFRVLARDRGVLLLSAKADFSYDVKFDFDDLDRWRITKLDGASGIPEGESVD